MKRTQKIRVVLIVALFAILLVSGCWLFGITKVLNYDIEDEIVSTDTHFNSVVVDLTSEEDWKDNQDKLDDIYSLFFSGKITNYESTPATGQLYIYRDTTLHTIAEVRSSATLVLSGLTLPADSTVRIPVIAMNLQPVKDLIKKGKFALYAIATDVPFDIRVFDSQVVVIFAVEAIL